VRYLDVYVVLAGDASWRSAEGFILTGIFTFSLYIKKCDLDCAADPKKFATTKPADGDGRSSGGPPRDTNRHPLPPTTMPFAPCQKDLS